MHLTVGRLFALIVFSAGTVLPASAQSMLIESLDEANPVLVRPPEHMYGWLADHGVSPFA